MKIVQHVGLVAQSIETRTIVGIRASKYLRLLAFSAMLGTFDGLQAKYMTIGNLGKEEALAYQSVFMLVAVAVAYFGLHDDDWTPARNLSNLLMAIPVATLADNLSIDIQMLRPYLLLIPKDGFLWRIDVFGHTLLSPVAYWVNAQTLAPGLINGYVAAFGIFASYLLLQHYWIRTGLDSLLPDWKLKVDFHSWRRH